MFVGQRLRGVVAKERAEDLEELGRLTESGALTPVIDRTYPLTEAPDAIRYLAQGHPAGKVVVTVGDQPTSTIGQRAATAFPGGLST
jgi:NADPH:quinone reductase-like Zn-dependent oxidoreductase